MNRPSKSKTAARLLITASALAFAAPALAHETLFASDASLGHAAETGERVTQQSGVTQIRLSGGGVASFVAGASYQIRRDGSVDLFAGTVTVAGTEGSPVVVHLADQGEGRVAGRGSAASFSVDVRDGGRNEARGHVLTGLVTIIFGTGSPRQFSAGQMWHGASEHVSLAVANGAVAVPTGNGSNSTVEQMGPHDGERASLVAAANNGVPVVLGDALAAAGASGDIVAAARRVQAASANPSIETYPARDLAALVAYAARLNGAYGGVPFNGAAADIIRTYLQFLSSGGAQANFLSAYAGFMVQYLDLIRAGALPSSFRGASLAQINSFISFRGRTVGFSALSGQNKVLIDAYLAFIQGGGNADQFLVRYTDLTAAYFTYIRGGGSPSAFTGASQATITAYLIFLRDAGLLANLTAQNQALLTAYLNSLNANGSGLAFADQYRTSLNLYYIYLQQGRLPSGYTAADVAALRQYLETLKSTGLFDTVLGSQASFFSGYLVWLQGGGAIDGYGQLPANIFAGYTSALTAYYDYLKQGGTPSGYTALTQAQISAYLLALQNAGASARYLGDFASFWTDYFAWINAGNNPNLFAGLPVPPDYPAFTSALNAYYVYLSNGGLPSNYSALTLEQLRNYINALIAAGRLSDLGGNASFLSAYFTYLGNGGVPNGYAQLPVYVSYQSALTAYYTYLQNGGLPSAYSALTPAQLQAYLQALINAGVYSSLFSGQTASFLTSYYTFVSGGGSANAYTGLPAYASYVSALNLYFVYLQGGGIPGNYTALTLAQLQAYLQAMIDAGVISQFFTGSTLTFFQGYYSYVQGGGTANSYSGLATIATGGGSGSAGGSSGGTTPPTAPTGTGMLIRIVGSTFYPGTTNRYAVGTFYTNTPVTVAASADGQLQSTNMPGGQFARGTASSAEFGTAGGVIGWTRWAGGTVTDSSNSNAASDIPTNGGMSAIWGAPATSVPTTGTVNYSVVGSTKPILQSGAALPGTLNSAHLAVNFAQAKAGFDANLTVGGSTYNIGSIGGATSPSMVVGINSTFSEFGSTAHITGFLTGPGANYAGVSYNIFGPGVSGVIAFGNSAAGGSGSAPQAAPTGGSMTYATLGAVSNSPFNATKISNIALDNVIATGSTVTAAADGKITSVTVGGGTPRTTTINTAAIADFGTAGGAIGWARWDNGSADYTPQASSTSTQYTASNSGIVHIWGPTATNVPTTGSVNYTLAGGTKPVLIDGSVAPGTLNSAVLAVNFSTFKVGLTANVTLGGQTYAMSTTGGTAAPSATLLSNNWTFFGGFDPALGASGTFRGFLSGSGASAAGVNYQINLPANIGIGAIGFTKGP